MVMRFGLACESGAKERRIKELARGIAGEHASGPIGAVRARGESHRQYARPRITKTGDRFAPIFPVAVSATFDASNLFPPGNEARALPAGEEFGVEGFERHEVIRES